MTIPYLFALVVNATAFLAFGLDKWKAQRGRRRIPEATLLLLAAAGGAPGAWLGLRVFRHKSNKRSFQGKLCLATLVAVGLAAALWRAWPGP